ncbi:PKD domain-containing protein [Chitinophaga sp. Mgbs1]|uniref:PKD domain-containing protein n=1 Tax=Chitinophaga solisilvae TaxID=1233460 RepID=A0A9Q5DBB8_9BACT|nr:PKD domain-containing protein [Chitinophaga solisilvae]
MYKATTVAVLLLTLHFICRAQAPRPQPVFPPDTVPAEIIVSGGEDSLQLSAGLRPLRQIAGAPAAFYTYFWELGDGTFSFSKNPQLHYKDTGTYRVRLYATNNYDDGKAPPTKPRPIKVKKPVRNSAWASHFFRGAGNIEMKINRNPRPGENFMLLMGYRNVTGDVSSGSLLLFYNEKQFAREGFKLEEKRSYHQEDSSSLQAVLTALQQPDNLSAPLLARGPAPMAASDAARTMVQSLQAAYSTHTVLHYSNASPGAEQFLFLEMHTLPEMIQDTNATVTITAMLVPDNPQLPPETWQLEMAVVASHDPNRLQLKKHRINYRLMGRKKELTYKVQFQNTGKGPARRVAIGIAVPRQLNTASITLKEISPACVHCDSAYQQQSCIDTIQTKDSVYFVFRNIYLPGLQQEGVTDEDSTRGFVRYSVLFKKKPKKIPFSSSAAIIFDRNEPVYTNRAVARFIKGISPAIIAGYNFSPNRNDYTLRGPVQFGVALAPFSPDRPFFQAEAYAGILEKETSGITTSRDKRDTVIGRQPYLIAGRGSQTTITRNSLQLVPLHFRYNINRWMAAGVGVLAQVNITTQTTVTHTAYLSNPQQPATIVQTVSSAQEAPAQWFGSLQAAPFADLQAGRVKTGPAIGIRYLRQLSGETPNRFFVYATYKL